MIRVLHVVGKMHRAGQETFIMNMYRHMDTSKIQFDFLVHTQEHCDYDDEILARGGKIWCVPKIGLRPFRYLLAVKKVIKDHDYQVVHCHTAHSMGFIILFAAKLAGTPIRICHSHNSQASPIWLHRLGVPWICHYATNRLACAVDAGNWMYGRRSFQVIENSIDTSEFYFQPQIREEIRQQMDLSECLVLGNVGRFNAQKNHVFLIQVFDEIVKSEPAARLMLVGEGEEMEKIRLLVAQKGLQEKVLFLGNRADVPKLLMAMDVLVMPSLFEGLSVAAVEAQTTGLPCVFSDQVATATKRSEDVCFVPIEPVSPTLLHQWVQTIQSVVEKSEEQREKKSQKMVHRYETDIEESVRDLVQIYRKAEKKEEKVT